MNIIGGFDFYISIRLYLLYSLYYFTKNYKKDYNITSESN